MAKENNEICDTVKKCKILLLDIEGTTTSISFVKDKLFPYAEEHVKGFLVDQWESDDVKQAVAYLRNQADIDQNNSVEGFIAIPGKDATKDEQIEGLVKNVKWQMAADRKNSDLKFLQGLIWKLGYYKGEIKGHVYEDVYPALKLWISTAGQKVYIYSSGSVQAQKLLFNKSVAGDMLPLIEGHFDTAVGAKQEAASYAAIVEEIGCKPEEILFLTDILKEAEAARASGLHAALVSREGNAPLPAEASAFPLLHSFEQLTITNKRKPEQQVEVVPAKVPKTEAQNDVKTSETESAKTNGSAKAAEGMETVAVVEKAEAPETMEVEETRDVAVTETKETLEKKEPVVETKTVTAEIMEVEETRDVETNETLEKNESVVETKIVTAETLEVEETRGVAVIETKETVEKNESVVETKTVTAEVTEIIEKDVPMDDAVVDVPAVTELPPVETTAVMADSTEIAETLVSEPVRVTAPSDESTAEEEIKVPQVAESDGDKVICNPLLPKQSVKMVDAATLTEFMYIAPESIKSPVVDPVESKSAEPKIEETPAAEATAEVSPALRSTTEEVVTDAMDAPATESKDIEADISPITDVVDSNKMEADTANSKIEVTLSSELKTEGVSYVDSKPMESVEDIAEAEAKKANGTAIDVTEVQKPESSNVSDSTEVVGVAVDEKLSATETEPVQNGVAKSADKQTEMAIKDEVDVPDQKDPEDAQAGVIEAVVEKVEEKTEANVTEKIETDAGVTVEEVVTVEEPKEPAEKGHEDTNKEAILSTMEVKDITDDIESLSEVTNIIDDVVPIVEEPSHLEEMEELQYAGLEKEYDEILSNVQDVTNLNYMPVKPLHTIAEEMETENMDSNDIVERILDTEMELSMKPEEIDLNTVQEITEMKTDTDERIGKTEPGSEKSNQTPKIKDVAEEKMEVSSDAEMVVQKPAEPKVDNAIEATIEPIVEEMETEETKVESVKPQETKADEEVPVAVEPVAKPDETEAKSENKETHRASVAVAQENGGSQVAKIDKATDTSLNGKSNGDAIVKLNGDARKEEDLKSRLTAGTGKEKVNGSNRNSADIENVQGDNKVDAETPDIKVKTVATDEAHAPIEQPVEA